MDRHDRQLENKMLGGGEQDKDETVIEVGADGARKDNNMSLRLDDLANVDSVKVGETFEVPAADILAEVSAANFQHDLLISFK